MASFRVDEDDDSQQVALNFLDFSKVKIRTREDLNSALWKLPELRLRQEHVSESDIIILDKVTSRPSEYFTDPIPEAMRNIRIRDLSQVDIDWKMLTLARPLSKLEEDAFSRFIELDKLNVKTMAADSTSTSRRNFSQDRIFHPLKTKPGLNIKSYSNLKRNKFCFEDLEEEKEHAMNQEFTYSFYERECKEEENQDLPELLALTENLLKPSKQKGTSDHVGNKKCHTSKRKTEKNLKKKLSPSKSRKSKKFNISAKNGLTKAVSNQSRSAITPSRANKLKQGNMFKKGRKLSTREKAPIKQKQQYKKKNEI